MNTVTIYKVITSFIAGLISYWLGGYDLLLKTLLSMTCLDIISGTIGACRTKSLKASKFGEGITNKIFMYIMVAVAVTVQRFTGNAIPLRESVIVFYIIYEGLSVVENCGKFVKYPDKMKEVFEQLQGGLTNNE